MMVTSQISYPPLKKFSPENVQSILLTVFRLSVAGGLEANHAPVTPETVAALFDHLIDLSRAAQPDTTLQANTHIHSKEGANHD